MCVMKQYKNLNKFIDATFFKKDKEVANCNKILKNKE
jgi:hypothetical protein